MDVEDEVIHTVEDKQHHPFVQTEAQMDRLEEDENLFELEIKNLDTNEIFKMQIPIGSGEREDVSGGSMSGRHSNPNYASKRRHEKNQTSISNIQGSAALGSQAHFYASRSPVVSKLQEMCSKL